MKDALDGGEEGQVSRDKSGLGYHGERVVFAPPPPKLCKSTTGSSVQTYQSKLVPGSVQPVQPGLSEWRQPPPPGFRYRIV